MKIKRFLQEDQAAVAVEYVILVAFAGLLLVGGVTLMVEALSGLFGTWANYFNYLEAGS